MKSSPWMGPITAGCARTHVITDQDNILDVVEKYVTPSLQPGGHHLHHRKSGGLYPAPGLSHEGYPPPPPGQIPLQICAENPYGIGLGIPETMEMALQECGTIRILFAAAVSAVGKLFGIRAGSTK